MPEGVWETRIVSRRGWVLFVAMSVIWGLPYLLIRIAVRDLGPETLVFARTAPAGLVLLPLAWRRDALRPLLGRWRAILAYTTVELAVPWFLLFDAERRLSSSFSGLLIATVPLFGAVLSVLLGADRPDLRQGGGLVLGFVGVALLVGLGGRGANLAGVLEVLACALGYATGPMIISRRLGDLPPIGPVTASLLLTAALYAGPALTHLPGRITAEELGAVIGLIVVCTAVAFLLFFRLISEVGPSRAVVITYVNPVVAVLLGVTILGEPFTTGIAVGFPLVLLGSLLAVGRARGPANRASVASRYGVPEP